MDFKIHKLAPALFLIKCSAQSIPYGFRLGSSSNSFKANAGMPTQPFKLCVQIRSAAGTILTCFASEDVGLTFRINWNRKQTGNKSLRETCRPACGTL
jgi:hypothetical protein